MLLKGLHDFSPRSSDSAQTLHFSSGDILLFLEPYARQRHWFRVVNSGGSIGYIPSNYVTPLEEGDLGRDAVLKFATAALSKARRDRLPSIHELERLLDDVGRVEFRQLQSRTLAQALKYQGQGQNHGQGHQNDVELDDGTTYTLDSDYKLRRDSKIFLRESESMTSIPTSDGADTSGPYQSPRHSHLQNAPGSPSNPKNWAKMADKLIKIVQESGGLDPKRSETVVHRLLYHMQASPLPPEGITSVLQVLQRSPDHSGAGEGSSTTSDASPGPRVAAILQYLSGINRSSTRNANHVEPELLLVQKLDQLRTELADLDVPGLKQALISEPGVVQELMEFYQNESRTPIKFRMIEIFSMIAALDAETRTILAQGCLPALLGKELMTIGGCGGVGDGGQCKYPAKCSVLATTLTSLLAAGASPSSLGPGFISFLLSYVQESTASWEERFESEPWMENELAASKADVVTLLLMCNLTYKPKQDENLVVKALAGRPSRRFYDTILTLFETGEDPVSYGVGCDLEPGLERPHSVFKLMGDLFSSRVTAEVWLKPDMKRVLDALVRKLEEFGPGAGKRTQILDLLRLIWRNRAFPYKIKEVRESLVAILLEEDPLSWEDQKIVKSMSKEFPSIFRKSSATPVTRTESPF